MSARVGPGGILSTWGIIVEASQKVFDFFLNASHIFTDFLNKPITDVIFEKVPLLSDVLEFITDALEISDLTVFDLILGSGLTIFLGITFYKWIKGLLP